jgi:hypothetical protein
MAEQLNTSETDNYVEEQIQAGSERLIIAPPSEDPRPPTVGQQRPHGNNVHMVSGQGRLTPQRPIKITLRLCASRSAMDRIPLGQWRRKTNELREPWTRACALVNPTVAVPLCFQPLSSRVIGGRTDMDSATCFLGNHRQRLHSMCKRPTSVPPRCAATPEPQRVYLRLSDAYARTGSAINVDFRDLAPWVRSPDYATHQLHPYPGKLLVHIVSFFLRALAPILPPGPVLDPFSGSGTVPLETSLMGRLPLSCDANPFAEVLTVAKTTKYSPSELHSHLEQIEQMYKRKRYAPDVPIIHEQLWYTARNKKQLNRLKCSIDTIVPPHTAPFFHVCFALTARKMSFADPSIAVPVRLKERRNFSPIRNTRIRERLKHIETIKAPSEFRLICESNIARVESANAIRADRLAARSVGSDARSLVLPGGRSAPPLQHGSVPLIITSPPYGSAQKYVRTSSLALNWLGLAGPKMLSALEQRSIGREHLPAWASRDSELHLPPFLHDSLCRIKELDTHRAKITLTYFAEMTQALGELARVLTPEGRIVIIIGNNSVCGEIVRNDIFVLRTLTNFGLRLQLHLTNDIRAHGLMTKRNTTAAMITQEHALVFEKPRAL